MNTKIIIPVLAVSLAALFSCEKINENNTPATEPDIHTLSVAFPTLSNPDGTKVSLATNGKTQWEVGDKIVIFGQPSSSDDTKRVVHEIVANDITDPEVAIFDVDFSGLTAETSTENYHAYNVAFPYTDGQPYYYDTGSNNYGRIRFQETNQPLLSGYVSDDQSSIVLNHLTAAITFSVSGDFDSYIFSGRDESEVVGYSNLIVEVNKSGEGKNRQKYNNGGTTGPLTSITGSVNGDGSTVNHVFIPVNAERSGSSPDYTYDTESQRYANVVYLPNGFTIKFIKNGDIVKYISSSAPLVIKPGHMINLGVLPSGSIHDYVPAHASSIPIGSAKKDLGADDGTANCYFINPADAITNEKGSIFKFEAVKGNSSESVGNISSVSVLWRTFNNATTPGDNDVVKAVDYDNTGAKTYIVFQLPDSQQAGNAVIAAKNAGGTILWSWHIWVPATAISTITDATNLGPEMMTRNLGALRDSEASASNSVESFGFLYQWGRKDPFPGMRSITKWPSAAKVNGTATTFITSEEYMTIEESLANPTKLKLGKDTDWVNPSNSNLWKASEKTIYDPCPPGYRVPAWDNTKTIWSGNLGLTAADYNTTNGWFKVGDAVFPFAAYYFGGETSSTSLQYGGERALYWTATANSSSKGYCLFQKSGATDATALRKRYVASVRCVAE